MTRWYYAGDTEMFRSHSKAAPNHYTDAHALLGVTAALANESVADDSKLRNVLFTRAETLAESLVENLIDDEISLGGGSSPTSPVVSFQVMRAIDGVANVWRLPADDAPRGRALLYLDDLVRDEARRRGLRVAPRPSGHVSVRERVTARVRADSREAVVRQLGLQSGRDPEFDPGTLLAAICILQRFGGRSGRQLIARGIEVLGECQDPDGSWRADLLTTERKRLVYLSSLEMATFVANLLIADLSTGAVEFLEPVLAILEKCFAHLEAGYIDLGSSTQVARGWGNDRTRQGSVAEVWTTALALQLVLRLHRISILVEQQEILRTFRVEGRMSARSRWPDLHGVLPDPGRTLEAVDQRIQQTLGRASDPTTDRQLIGGIAHEVVRPIMLSRAERPVASASLLLCGPPGTRKTSLVGAIARALGWPLVVVSPPDFLLEGIEGLERRAQEIFAGLTRLRRVVVLFDECEELLRRRLPVELPENRTHGAFITAGMLPRLQDLRDRSWCVFAIVTNTELDELDPAVVRRGRLDLKRMVGHPTVSAQRDYLIERLNPVVQQRQATARQTPVGLLSTEVHAINSGLNRYDTEQLEQARKDLAHDRQEAAKKRKAGDLKAYFSELGKIVAREWDMPQVTFGVLDEVVSQLASVDPLEDLMVLNAITAVAADHANLTEEA